MLLGGIFEAIQGNSYAFTVFIIYSGFWLSYGILLIPGTGGLTGNTQALGLFFISWWAATLVRYISLLCIIATALTARLLLAGPSRRICSKIAWITCILFLLDDELPSSGRG